MLNGMAMGFSDTTTGTRPVHGGSWGNNRGRVTTDELRMWGYPDNSNWGGNAPVINAGAAKYVNTNPQAKVASVFFPQDTGSVINVGSGSFLMRTSMYSAAYNMAGTFLLMPGNTASGANPGGFENNTLTVAPLQFLGSTSGVTIPTMVTFNSAATYTSELPGAVMTNLVDCGISPTLNVRASSSAALAATSVTSFQTGGGATATAPATAGNLTVTTWRGLHIQNPNVSASVPQSGGSTNNITTLAGVDIDTLTAGGTNYGLRVWNGNATLLNTASAFGHALEIMPSTYTYNAANVILPTVLNFSGTHQLQQSAFSLSMGVGVNFSPTFTNQSAATGVNLAPYSAVIAQPTYTANTETGMGISTQSMFVSQPTTSVSNSGTITGGTLQGFESNGATIGSGTTGVALNHFIAVSSAPSGTLSAQTGLTIANMMPSNVTTGIGIKLAGQPNPLQLSTVSTGPTTANLTSNTNAVMTVYFGGTNYYLLFAWNDGGTVRYKYLPLTGTSVTWATGTTLPT